MKISKNLFVRMWNYRINKKKQEEFEKKNPDLVLAGSDLDDKVEKLAGLINKDLNSLKEFFKSKPGVIIAFEDIEMLLQSRQSITGQNLFDKKHDDVDMLCELAHWLDTMFVPINCKFIDGYMLIEQDDAHRIFEESRKAMDKEFYSGLGCLLGNKMKISKNLFVRIWNKYLVDKKMAQVDLDLHNHTPHTPRHTAICKKEKALVERMVELTNEINYDLDKVFNFFVANPGKIIDIEHILRMLQLKQHEKWTQPNDIQYSIIYDYVKEYLGCRLTVISEDEFGFLGYMFIDNKKRNEIRNESSNLIKSIE